MTTLIPRQFYSQEELDKLYPQELELQLVQIVSTDAASFFVYHY
jgi:acid phosphatase